jgi:hypothetical protein
MGFENKVMRIFRPKTGEQNRTENKIRTLSTFVTFLEQSQVN